ncbi:MAG: hypothetical protein A2148_02880 [Chloroflexi bacterium RBG_16_68_14]|nr:MAG: hypothetical protein A2148_02880 [Chloroflexi bacterium RBG_16_68_14]
MEPRIQYAMTSDGMNIACSEMGQGLSLVNLQGQPFTNIQLFQQSPFFHRWFERLGEGRRLILLDGRGSGLSQREVTDFSLDARVQDIEAVVDKLGLERFALMALSNATPVAVTYAARHPERVSHLLLWEALARGADYFDAPRVRALWSLIEKDWELFADTVGHIVYGWSPDESREFAKLIRESLTQPGLLAFTEAARTVDVTHLLPQIAAPTLVVQMKGTDYRPVAMARELAARIPDARLVVLEGSWLDLFGNSQTWRPAVDEFLGTAPQAAQDSAPQARDDIHTILFTDIEGSTALTQRLGDAKAQEVLRAHNTIVRDTLREHGGQEIKHTGDGIMASFPSASGALECAVAIQLAVAGRKEPSLRIHIGLNAGEPIAEDDDLFGTAVQLARRICDHAEGGQVLVSNVVRELAAGKGFLFGDIGDVVLKGFEQPVRLYEVRWREHSDG